MKFYIGVQQCYLNFKIEQSVEIKLNPLENMEIIKLKYCGYVFKDITETNCSQLFNLV